MSTLAERIAFGLAHSGMKRRHLAIQIGVTPATITNWMNGTAKSITGEHLVRAAQAMNVDPAWLITGEGHWDDHILTIKELELLRQFDRLSEPQQDYLLKMVEFTATGTESKPDKTQNG